MTLDTVFVVGDTFFPMFFADFRARVFMTTVAGIRAVVVVDVAGGTLGVVMAVETKVLVMFESGRMPGILAVALGAITFDF